VVPNNNFSCGGHHSEFQASVSTSVLAITSDDASSSWSTGAILHCYAKCGRWNVDHNSERT
jgi:hypothetical protein